MKGKHATFVAHTAGRYQRKKFRKAQVWHLISVDSFFFIIILVM